MATRARLLSQQLTSADTGAFLVVAVLPLIVAPFADYSFANPKLVVLLIGTLLLAWTRPVVDRTLILVGCIWLGGLSFAAAFGMDPFWSVMGSEHQNVGIITLGACVLLLALAPGLPQGLRERLPYWLFWTGVLVAGVSVLTRFVLFGVAYWRIDPLGSTIGHRVYVGGFLAAATVTAAFLERRPIHIVGLVVLASGLSVSAVRSAWLGAVLGMAVTLLTHRSHLRKVAVALLPVIAVSVLWVVVTPVLPEHYLGYSAAQRFGDLDEGSAVERPAALSAFFRGWKADPILGTGPSTGWYVFLRHATRPELQRAGRGFADAHNIVAELAATSGLVGLIPLAVLGVLVLARVRGAPPTHAWAQGAAIALAIMHLFQPYNIVLTPMLFFTAGLAIRSPPNDPRPVQLSRWLVIPVALALVLASARLLAASFEQYGRLYASERGYRWALAIEPRRMEAVLNFAKFQGFDARSGDEDAEREARQLVERAIDDHGWNPRVRAVGGNVMALMEDLISAERMIDRHLAVFPNDGEGLAAKAALALRRRDTEQAIALANEALQIFPESKMAHRILLNARELQSEPSVRDTPAEEEREDTAERE